MMMRRWISRLTIATIVLLLGLLGLVRFGGLLVTNADGRAIGYSSTSGEWLMLEYANHPAAIDGPYVLGAEGQRNVLRLHPDAAGVIQAQTQALTDSEIEIRVDNTAGTRFTVPLRGEHPRAATDVAMPDRLLIASDFEGEFDAFVALMQAHGVIDAQLRWSFGPGHLVLVGDMVDRGRNVLPLLWLVYKLEAEAAAAGGALHYLLGNHEQKLLVGNTSDVAGKYYATFRLSGRSQRELFDETSELGRWLRSKPVLLKVGEHLFMHGGLSPEVLALQPTLDEVDRYAASFLARPPQEVDDARAKAIIWDRNGVLWYRGLAMARDDMPKASDAHVQQVLRHYGVRHLVIGHTLARHVGYDYAGAVWRVDVHHAGGTREGLLVEGGNAYRVDELGRREALGAVANLD